MQYSAIDSCSNNSELTSHRAL